MRLSLILRSLSSLTVVACFAGPALADDPKPLPIALVDSLNAVSGGPHAGYRANHAKGVLVSGTFTPSPTAASLSKAPHFRQKVPVVVRFSDTTGVPTIPDPSPDASPHGMAIRFKLAGGQSTDIVSISANSFPVATPEDFVALLTAVAASGPTAPKPTPIEQFLGSHPAALKFVTTPWPAPISFATLAYYGVNAFKFTNAKGETHFVRYQILPLAGEHALDDAASKAASPTYLMDELPARIAKGPVKFRLVAQVAKDGDPTNDATQVWPDDRKLVELGTIALTAVSKDQVKDQKTILFNPVNLPAGIDMSDDPVLAARFPAYAISYRQRAN